MPLSGGPQMVDVSCDGRRVYFTTWLHGSWDDQVYPDSVGRLDGQARRRLVASTLCSSRRPRSE